MLPQWLYREDRYESFISKDSVWMKVFPSVGIILERMMTVFYFTSWNVNRKENEMSIPEVTGCIRIALE